MINRTTELLLLAIAIGLWMNVAIQWLRLVPVHAAVETAQDLNGIAGDVRSITIGLCVNGKIC